MNDIDLKLKLFAGRPVIAKGYGHIYPLKIKEIVDVGYSEYMKYLNILTLNANDFLDSPTEEVHILDLLIKYGGSEIENVFEQALSLFLRGEVLIDKQDIRVFIKISENEINIVDKDNYYEIQEVLKWQNYINTFEEKKLEDFDPADEETRKLKEQMDAIAKKRDELKRKQNQNSDEREDEIDFYDILSAIASKSYGVNELNVIDLTIYQVYRKFKRMEIIDQYDLSIKSILAGAKDVKIRHWSSKE